MKLSRDFAYDPKSYNNKYMTPEELESAREFLKNSTQEYGGDRKTSKGFYDKYNRHIGDYLNYMDLYNIQQDAYDKFGINKNDPYLPESIDDPDFWDYKNAEIYRRYNKLKSLESKSIEKSLKGYEDIGVNGIYKGPDGYLYVSENGSMKKLDDQLSALNSANQAYVNISDHPDYNKFVEEYNKNFDNLI